MITTNLVIPTYIDKKEIQTEGPNVIIMTITPDIAEFWLKTYNSSNRPLSTPHVAFLANQMIDGEWIEMNGTMISFNRKGQLNDGQHRLAAIIKSGISLRYIVMVGVHEDSFKVMDTGKTRGGADVLSIEGFKCASLKASIVKFVINYKNGQYTRAANSSGGVGSKKITNNQVLKFANENKGQLTQVSNCALNYYGIGDRLLSKTMIGGLLYLLGERDVKKAESFLFKLATGSDIPYKSVLYLLRTKLKLAKDSDSKHLSLPMKLAYIIKTWNSIRKGKELKIIRFHPSKGEKFPEII